MSEDNRRGFCDSREQASPTKWRKNIAVEYWGIVVGSLQVALDELARSEIGSRGRISRGETKDAALRLRNLSVGLDDRTTLVANVEIAILPGEKVLVTGESGSGKSTLVRALVGLWPWGDGHIEMRSGVKLFIAPPACICTDRHTPTRCKLSRCAR